MRWNPVCHYSRLPVDRGVCVLVEGEQVALVRTGGDGLYAVGNLDPHSDAMVMSRGIVGSRGDRDVLVSPLHKQVYDLTTGECLDDPSLRLAVFGVRRLGDSVEVTVVSAVC